MINVETLKKKVLDLAMRGKLVPQDASDEPASVLIEKIKVEKDELIKAKKIKKTKVLPTIESDEIPYQIPDSWEWVRLGEIFNIGSASRVLKSEWKNEGIPFYRAREIVALSKGKKLINPLFIDEETYNEKVKKSGIPQRGDILITGVGTLGISWIIPNNNKIYFKDASVLILKKISSLCSEYFKLILESNLFTEQILKVAKGTAVKTLTITNLNQIICPIPPLAEQKRIVTKIEEIFAELDKIESASNEYDKCKELLNKRVLDLAMRGKLVPQDANDEPASVLIEKIKAEKDELIKAKKIKKTKALPPIEPDEIPYQIPDSWEWVRLGCLGNVYSGGTPSKNISEYWDNKEIPWITPAQLGKIQNDIFMNEPFDFISTLGLKKSSAQLVPKGSIVYSSRAPIGHINIVNFDFSTNQGAKSLQPIIVNSKYIYFSLNASRTRIEKMGSGSTFKEISKTKFSNIILPLPPLAEQKRIVAKIEEIQAQLKEK